MTCDLQKLFRTLSSSLPKTEDDEFVLCQSNLPRPPAHLHTDALAATWDWHFYSMPVARVDFFARNETFRALGLLVLAKVFHPDPPRVTIHLAKPGSSGRAPLKRLVLDYSYNPSHIPGYARAPDRFSYIPETPAVHPWSNTTLAVADLPQLVLGDPEHPAYEMKDVVETEAATGFGHDHGNVLIGELLLNLGNSLNEETEVALEGEMGCRGVGAGSAEIRFFVPGHVFYNQPRPW